MPIGGSGTSTERGARPQTAERGKVHFISDDGSEGGSIMSGMKRLVEDIEVLILKGLSTEEIAKSLNMPNDLAEAMVYDVEQMMLGTLDTELTYEDMK